MYNCVASTIRKLAELILSYDLKQDPIYKKLKDVEQALTTGPWNEKTALSSLASVERGLELKADSGIPALATLLPLHTEVMKLIKDGADKSKILVKIKAMTRTLERSEPAMKKVLYKPQAWQVLSSPVKELAELILADYTLEKDPSYKKITDALVAAGRNDFSRAKAFLYQVGHAIETKEQGYKEKIPALRGIYDLYKDAMNLCDEENSAAVEKLTILVDTLKKTEKDVNKVMYPNRYQP